MSDLPSELTFEEIEIGLTKKFNIPIVPIFIEREEALRFRMKVYEPIHFSDKETIESWVGY